MVDKLLHTAGVPDTAIFLCNLQTLSMKKYVINDLGGDI